MRVIFKHNKELANIALILVIVCLCLIFSTRTLADTFSDNFSSVSYSNQDGSHNWASDWVEVGDNGNANSGDIQITGGELALDDNDNSISRQVDLSGYISATLTFDYREDSFDNTDDYVDFEIRTGGGGWTQLQRFIGPTDDSGTYTVDISTYLASDTEIRFITSSDLSDFDDFYVDNLVVDATAAAPSATYLDLFGSVSYSNQDGVLNWATDWNETNDDNSPSGGDINITGGELHLQDDGNSISRQVDLSAVTSATLSFDYREVSLDNSNEYVDLQIRTGGGSWNQLQRFTGPTNDSGNYSVDISSYLAADTEIRFVTSSTTSMNNNDDFYVDNFAIDTVAGVSLVLDYRMDADLWNGSTGEVLDYSGSGSHGTSIGGGTTDDTSPTVAGDPGTCRYGVFDGIDDYINAGNISDTLNATASMAFWIRTTQIGNNTGWQAPGVAGVEESGGSDDIFWGWLDASGRIGISVGNTFTTKSTASINNGNWHHVVLTRDHDVGAYKIYIDGALDSNGVIAAGLIGNSYTSIGRIEDTGGSPEYLDGDLDEVRIYSGVLSDAEVATIYTETHPCTASLCPNEIVQGGLIGDYYNGIALAGGVVNSRVDGPINFDWGSGSPGVTGIGANLFSIQWNGWVRATETGSYQFRTLSDDGVRLYVDGNLVINNWTDHAVTTDTSGSVTLNAGQIYPVVLEFYENGGLAEIRLQWQTPSGGSFIAIPAGPSVLNEGLYSCTSDVVSYYEISHSGAGLTCEAEPITFTAFDATMNPVNPPNGTTITFSTTPTSGVWAGGNTFTFDGTANSTDQYLQQTTVATLNIDVSDGSAGESASADPDITFSDVGIKFYGDTASSPLPNQIAGVTDANMSLRVVEASNDTGACVTRLQNTSRDVDLAYECRNPSACSAGQTLSLDGSSVQSNDSGASISYTTVNLSFDVNGFAAIPFNYSDVGLIRLHADMDLPVENNDPAITVSGSSSEFVVKPFSLVINNVETTGGVANPGGTQTGSGFVAAGDNFVVQLEGRNASGVRTPAFGREISPENVQVDINSLVFPAGGTTGSLANAASFTPLGATPGRYENINVSWDEVGSITLVPAISDSDYLGAGDVTGIVSSTIGRFYPAEITLAAGTVDNSCSAGAFSYMSESDIDISYSVAARNSAGAVTTNYDNTDFTFPTTVLSLHAEDSNDGIELSSRISAVVGTWDDGVYAVTDTSAVFLRSSNISGDVLVDGPFSNTLIGLQSSLVDDVNFSSLDFKPNDNNNCVVDSDCDSRMLTGSLNLLFGQLRLDDVHGPESAAIPMLWQTEYWNGSQFVVNTADQCTQLALTDISFVGASSVVDAVNDQIAVDIGGVSSIFDFSDPVGSSDCMSATHIGICDGLAGTVYGAPNSIATYPIDIDLTAYPQLQGDWNQDGNYNDSSHPRTYVRFQHYRGNDRVIYWRERLQ